MSAQIVTAGTRSSTSSDGRAFAGCARLRCRCWSSRPWCTSLTRDQDGLLGFVNAGAEASMVGAIADWFAVTALFKHPLGLPIPHTALIPKRKEMLGRSLEEFVGENFLQEAVIRERLDAARLSQPGRRAGSATSATPAGSATRSPPCSSSACRGSATRTWPRSSRRHCCRGSSRSRSARWRAACWRRSSATARTTAWST